MRHHLLSIALATLLTLPAFAALRTDIEFSHPGKVSLTLDAFTPDGPGPFPTIIVVHGGGFSKGDKQTYVKPLFPVLSDAGFTWFTINYRLAPEYHFPAPVEDLEAAIQWVKLHATEYKVDQRRIALIGESAGGHLVAYVGAVEGRKHGLAAVVPFYTPHDLAGRSEKEGAVNPNIQGFLGVDAQLTDSTKALLQKASPYFHVSRNMPPFLLIHGTKDSQVDYSQSVHMQEKMKAAGASCDLFTVEGGNHGMGSWDKLPNGGDYKAYLVRWLKEKLQ